MKFKLFAIVLALCISAVPLRAAQAIKDAKFTGTADFTNATVTGLPVGPGGGTGDVLSTATVSVDNELALFSGVTGKQIKRGPLVSADVLTLLGGANFAAVKSSLSLGNVDNTSDANKPISTATQTALDGKQPVNNVLTLLAGFQGPDRIAYYTGVGSGIGTTELSAFGRGLIQQASSTDLKTVLSLDAVQNTSDANKPVSTAQQTALNTKLDAASTVVAHGDAGSAVTLTWTASDQTHTLTLNQSTCAITLAGFPASKDGTIKVKVTQDATGGRAATYSPTLAGGGTPTLDTAAGAVTWLQFWSDDGGTTVYYASTASTSSGGGPSAFTSLSDGATITWAVDPNYAHQNAKVTLGGNRALSITGATDGMHGTLKVTQDGTGSRGLTLPSGSRVAGNGAGLVTLSSAAAAVDKLDWCYDGSYFYFDAPKLNYTAAGDVTAPELTSATIGTNGTTFTMVFSETVSFGAGGNAGFAPTLSAGSPTLSYSSGSGSNTLVYTLSETVNIGVTGTLAYTQPGNGVEDAAGNDLLTFPNASITNNSTQGGGGGAAWADVATSAEVDTAAAIPNDHWEWTNITLPTGTATKIRIYIQTFNFSDSVKLALFNGTTPLQSGTVTVTGTGYAEVTITSQAVTSGTYRVGWIEDNNGGFSYGYKTGTGTMSYNSSGTTYGTYPATMPAEEGTVPRKVAVSVYVTP